MSDNIPPFEIQAEILKRVSEVKSLLQFRSVSKSWKSLIDSPQFIADYQLHPPRHHVFVWYVDRLQLNFVSIIDNDDDSRFGHHKVPLTIDIPESLLNFEMYGSSGGLFCLYRKYLKPIAYLWNPSIRKISAAIDVPNVLGRPYQTIFGFGVSPNSTDPKLVKVQTFVDDSNPRIVEVYSLSTGEWRTLLSENLPSSSVVFNHGNLVYGEDHHVAIGNFICWLAEDRNMKREMIVLFDMISEKFIEIYLPDNVVPKDPHSELILFKIQESLVVIESYVNDCVEKKYVDLWMMEGGVSDSFTKMYSIMRPDAAAIYLHACRNNGHPIIGMRGDEFEGSDELFVYEPDSEQFTPIGTCGNNLTKCAGSYMETLLLLDH